MATHKGQCYLCHRFERTEVHHVFEGTANRKISDREGLMVNLCHNCHRFIHSRPKSIVAIELKQTAQQVWMTKNGSKEDFMKLFGRNWLDD